MVKRLSNQDSNNTTSTNDRLSSPRLIGEVLDANGAKLIGQTAIASAVNYLVVQNADTGNDVWLYPGGSDSDIDLVLSGKGTGSPKLSTGSQIVGTTDTQTLTGKRITKRTGTTTSSATPTINTDNVDFYSLTAQTADITSFTTNLSGTPTENQTLWIAITGTASRAITWGASFEASTVALPTTTSGTSRLDVGFVWNTVSSKWRCVAVA